MYGLFKDWVEWQSLILILKVWYWIKNEYQVKPNWIYYDILIWFITRSSTKKTSLPGQVRSARQQQKSSSTPRSRTRRSPWSEKKWSGLDLGRNKQLGKMRKTSVAELWLDDLYLYIYIYYITFTSHYITYLASSSFQNNRISGVSTEWLFSWGKIFEDLRSAPGVW